MRPSDRVRLIRAIADELEAIGNYTDADLILRQFGLPWESEWDGSSRAYFIHQVEKGEDAKLLELYEFTHDGQPFDAVPTRPDVSHLWKQDHFRLFLSHISSIKVVMAELKVALARFGIDAFVAHEDIEPSREWLPEIELALDTCDGLAAFLTADFHSSKWTDQEVGFCVKRRVPIIPVQMGAASYGFLSRYQWLPGIGRSPVELADALFDLLLTNSLTADRMAVAVVRTFEESASFAAAKRNVLYLRRVRRWTPELLRRIEAAMEQNYEIANAFGVPVAVRELVQTQTASLAGS